MELDEVKAYLGESADGWTDDEITSALTAETLAQSRVCRVPADMPADLAEALKRRVARSLNVRALPLGYAVQVDDTGFGISRLGYDAEIRRLEAPWKKVTVG